MTCYRKVMTTPYNVLFRLSHSYMFTSYKVLLNSLKMNAVPLRSNYILIVETMLPYLLDLYMHYSKNKVVLKRTQV